MQPPHSSRRKLSRTQLWLGVVFAAAIYVYLLSANIAPAPSLPEFRPTPQPTPPPYPERFSLTVLPDGLNENWGFRVLKRLPDLRGSFCLSQLKKDARNPREPKASSVLQILEWRGSTLSTARNFEYPDHGQHLIDFIGWPLWAQDKQHLWVCAMIRGASDVLGHHVYAINLKSSTAQVQEKGRSLHHKFIVSPDGKSYAYETAEPYNNAWYRVEVQQRGMHHLISESEVSSPFSWTPRNTILYPAYSPKPLAQKDKPWLNAEDRYRDPKYFGYPYIYEDDLKGGVKLLKKGANRPLMSPNGRYLLTYDPYGDPKRRSDSGSSQLAIDFDRLNITQSALVILDLKTKKNIVVKSVTPNDQYDPNFLQLIWSSNSRRLYLIEQSYNFKQKMKHCTIEVFDVATRKRRLLCRMQQKGEAGSWQELDNGKLVPKFHPIKIANEKYLLCALTVGAAGQDNQRVLAIDLSSGRRHDILSFRGPASFDNRSVIDWIDARP